MLLIHASKSVCNRTKLHHCALLSHNESPWAKLYRCGDASSFLTMTSLSRRAFYLLHDLPVIRSSTSKDRQTSANTFYCTVRSLSVFILVVPWGSSTCVWLLESPLPLAVKFWTKCCC